MFIITCRKFIYKFGSMRVLSHGPMSFGYYKKDLLKEANVGHSEYEIY